MRCASCKLRADMQFCPRVWRVSPPMAFAFPCLSELSEARSHRFKSTPKRTLPRRHRRKGIRLPWVLGQVTLPNVLPFEVGAVAQTGIKLKPHLCCKGDSSGPQICTGVVYFLFKPRSEANEARNFSKALRRVLCANNKILPSHPSMFTVPSLRWIWKVLKCR